MKEDRMGSSLYLAGELEPWACILIVLIASGAAWWLYRSETKKGTAPPLNKLLPALRALAVALVVLTLAGPTLKNVSEKGERGRVLIFLDGSESMMIQDKHMSAGRKLLLAERHGWLPQDQQILDPTLYEAADQLSVARSSLTNALESPVADLNQIAVDFALTMKKAGDMLKNKNYEVAQPEERRGFLRHELWEGIPGSELSALINHPRFKDEPNFSGYLKSAQSPSNVGEDFGRKISGILIPPSDGEYRFWIYADDQCILKLNNAGENPDNAKEILRVPNYAPADWQESLRSRPIRLQQDKRYYLEVLHKEGGGDDFCAVGWTLPNGSLERPIPGKRFIVPNLAQTRSFADLVESMNKEVVQVAQSLRKGKGDGADADMRKALFELANECLFYENNFRETFDLYAEEKAAEKNNGIADALKDFDSSDRWKRATRLLTERQDSILRELQDTHKIEVHSLAGSEADHVWENGTDAEPPTDFGKSPLMRITDLASGVLSTVKADEELEEDIQAGKSRSAVVILSDGLHNKGSSPFDTAKLMAGRDIPIHTISFGSKKAPPDLAVLDVITPPMILKTDRAHGSITLKDNLALGTDFRVVVEDEQGNQVWDDNLTAINANRRRIDFDFPIEEMVEERILALGLDNSVEVNSVPLRFKARIEAVKGESRSDNNLKSFSFDAITKKNSVLIIDGRPRWETRYLRNVFARDERWSVTAVFAGPGSAQPDLLRGEDGESFPQDKKSLFAFDLVILGELAAGLLKEEELVWINEFATNRGGGILLLDGPRQKFREYAKIENHPIAQLLPVKWLDDTKARLSPESFRLTDRGQSETALFLDPSPQRNTELWSYLPSPGWVAPTEALPGTEVFLEATVDKEKYAIESVPLLVSRTAGAGRILYAGFDGTWRWRFEVGDKYHQRYWNQLASWIMEKPFAVRDDFVAIDPGASAYQPGESAALRIRVRDREGKPLNDPNITVEGLIWKEGKIVATVPLETNAESGGLFRGNTPPLSSGQHEVSVRVNGLYDDDELRSRVGFLVRQQESPELSILTCNEKLLQEVAMLSGGTYLREEQIGRLNDLLKPISSGKLVTKEIALWQSYWWFIPIVFILGLELFLRKRAGML